MKFRYLGPVFIGLLQCPCSGIDLGTHLDLIEIKGCRVVLGNPMDRSSREYHPDEKPVEVIVDDFAISRSLVTASNFCRFLNSSHAIDSNYNEMIWVHGFSLIGDGAFTNHSTIVLDGDAFRPKAGKGQAPANTVTWLGAALYCQWLASESGLEIRLPTEAEWELAARGCEGRHWPWGAASPTPEYGPRYSGDYVSWDLPPICSYDRNWTPEGVADMLAYQISEWCAGKYSDSPSTESLSCSQMDLQDCQSPRSLKGVWSKAARSEGASIWRILSDGLFSEPVVHFGKPWTREYAHPTEVVRKAAGYGFRVVVVPSQKSVPDEAGGASAPGTDASEVEGGRFGRLRLLAACIILPLLYALYRLVVLRWPGSAPSR